jgi:SSS family solute:Na+ symporter
LTDVAGAASLFSKVDVLHTYPSDMAQNLWGAIWAWSTCFSVTMLISVITRPRSAKELTGLVYGLAPRPTDHQHWLVRPATVGVVVLCLTAILNVIFW